MIQVRSLTEHAEFAEAVALQRQIWGFDDIDLLPARLFVVADKIGGFCLGAYDGDRMVGFCLALPGVRQGGQSYLHSHMMGVLPDYRNRGVGRQLKLAQRETALAEGVRIIEWTFDPLEIKNAYLNIERLGAVVERYVLNQYGITSSQLGAGLPTDRCVAEWHLDSRRVRGLLRGEPIERPPVAARIEVPGNISLLRNGDPAQARRIQASVSDQFVDLLGRGLAAVGLERNGDSAAYLLAKWPCE